MNLPEPYAFTDGYVLQTVGPAGALPAKLTVAGTEYTVCAQLVCRLVAVGHIADRLVAGGLQPAATAEATVLGALEPLIAKYRPRIARYRSEIRRTGQPGDPQQSLVIMVDVQGLAELFSDLSAGLRLDIPVQPASVTLYALPGSATADTSSQPLSAEQYAQWNAQIDMLTLFGITKPVTDDMTRKQELS